MRDTVVRGAAVLLLALGGVFALGLTPALAADPAPPPVPAAPYGGALDSPEPSTTFDEERVLEVSMLGLGSVNGLAFVGVLVVSRFRGRSTEETRRALINRTAPGVVPGERRARRAATRVAAEPAPQPAAQPAPSHPPIPHQGGPGVPSPRAPLAPPLRPAAPRR